MQTRTLENTEASVVYDIAGPLPTDDGRPPLFMIGQPMEASGFRALASYFPDRTVVTYDPRGLGRSTRHDGRVDNNPAIQAGDLHAIIETLGTGPVEMFASSGGAVTSLALVTAYPGDIATLVAHEPPLPNVLADADAANRAMSCFRDAYEKDGFGAGMAAFIDMASWHGEFTDAFFDRPQPDPAQFGIPSTDDGSRDDVLLSHRSDAITDYRPDFDALKIARTRIILGIGEESAGTFAARAGVAVAERLNQEPVTFPSHHGGFTDGGAPFGGKPEEFASKLREVLIKEPGANQQ
jgi:pimeloyl-ACP methyl ester carboxylesterase